MSGKKYSNFNNVIILYEYFKLIHRMLYFTVKTKKTFFCVFIFFFDFFNSIIYQIGRKQIPLTNHEIKPLVYFEEKHTNPTLLH